MHSTSLFQPAPYSYVNDAKRGRQQHYCADIEVKLFINHTTKYVVT